MKKAIALLGVLAYWSLHQVTADSSDIPNVRRALKTTKAPKSPKQPKDTKSPKAPKTHAPSALPTVSSQPSSEELTVTTSSIIQKFLLPAAFQKRLRRFLQNFNEEEFKEIFEDFMEDFTSTFSDGSEKVVTECEVTSLTLEPPSTVIVEYVMRWESKHAKVTDFEALFINEMKSNESEVIEEMNKAGLEVTEIVLTNPESMMPSATPSSAPSVSMMPSSEPSSKPSVSMMPSVAPSSAPSVSMMPTTASPTTIAPTTANPTTASPTSCIEDPNDTFFWKLNKNGDENTKNCDWLANDAKNNQLNNACDRTEKGPDSNLDPAKVVCKVTCGTCIITKGFENPI